MTIDYSRFEGATPGPDAEQLRRMLYDERGYHFKKLASEYEALANEFLGKAAQDCRDVVFPSDASLLARVKELEEALRFYANLDNYQPTEGPFKGQFGLAMMMLDRENYTAAFCWSCLAVVGIYSGYVQSKRNEA